MPLPKPPQAVTFDCWSTLITDLDWEATVKARIEALAAVCAREGTALDPERGRELIEGSWRQHVEAWRKGRMFGPRGASRWCLEQLGIDVSDALADELAESIAGTTSEAGTRVVEGAPEMLERVRSAGIATALICDTGFTPGRRVRRFLKEHGLRLDHYFFSDEVGSPKPFPPIFEAALVATGSAPSQAIHAGDLRRTDIAGARNAGMATIRFAGVHDDGFSEQESQGEEADEVLYLWDDLPSLIGI